MSALIHSWPDLLWSQLIKIQKHISQGYYMFPTPYSISFRKALSLPLARCGWLTSGPFCWWRHPSWDEQPRSPGSPERPPSEPSQSACYWTGAPETRESRVTHQHLESLQYCTQRLRTSRNVPQLLIKHVGKDSQGGWIYCFLLTLN